MVVKVLTLFGEEEIIAEPVKPVVKKPVPVQEAEKPKPTAIAAKPKIKKEKQVKVLPGTDALSKWEGDKQYYTIGEVAAIFKVNTSNIRFWTKEFEMKVRTTRKGDRLYTPEQVREINTIYHLVKERGYTISGAKGKMKENRKAAVQQVDLKKSLLVLKSKLLQIRKQLN